jgi:hypothetical protein
MHTFTVIFTAEREHLKDIRNTLLIKKAIISLCLTYEGQVLT